MHKQQRLLVGKQIHEGSMSPAECMAKYKVCYTSVRSWRRQYEESLGLAKARPQAKPLGVSAAAPAGPDYEAMEKPELIKELMRRDIEVSRLKKGYSVKGGGSKKEYVISSGSNTK